MKIKSEKRHAKIDPEKPVFKKRLGLIKIRLKLMIYSLNSCPYRWSEKSAARATTRIRINLP
jgi:hypothetical protein